jgi:histidinol-phosphate aminotransferase
MPKLRPALTTIAPAVHGACDYGELARLGLSPDKVIDFSANSNPYGPPVAVLQAVQAAVTTSTLAHYPDRDCWSLRAAIAAAEGASIEQLLPGNGANELIQLVAQALVMPGSRHLVFTPAFGEYARAIQLLGGQMVEPWTATHPIEVRLTLEAAGQAIQQHQPHAIWLCNPNNPTGQLWSATELAHLRQSAPARQAWWVVDESYHYFSAAPVTLKDEVKSGNLIILRSLTKDLALAGLRLGYILAAPDVIEALRGVQPAWSVNSLAQVAGVAALQAEVLAWREDSLAKLRVQANQLWAELTRVGLTVVPTETTYALVRVGAATRFRHQLLTQGLLVRDCTSFGLPDYVRIAAQQPAENQRLLDAIARIGMTM